MHTAWRPEVQGYSTCRVVCTPCDSIGTLPQYLTASGGGQQSLACRHLPLPLVVTGYLCSWWHGLSERERERDHADDLTEKLYLNILSVLGMKTCHTSGLTQASPSETTIHTENKNFVSTQIFVHYKLWSEDW